MQTIYSVWATYRDEFEHELVDKLEGQYATKEEAERHATALAAERPRDFEDAHVSEGYVFSTFEEQAAHAKKQHEERMATLTRDKAAQPHALVAAFYAPTRLKAW